MAGGRSDRRNLRTRGALKSSMQRLPKVVAWASVAAAVVIAGAMAALANAGRAGHPDPSFGKNGEVVVGEAHGYANAVAIGRSNRIVAAGTHSVIRLMPDGRLDRSFADGGIATLDSGAYSSHPSSVAAGPSSVALGAAGGIYVAGSSCSDFEHCDFAVSRLKPDGELDPSFGDGGTARIAFPNQNSWAGAIAKAPQGRLVVGGTSCFVASSCEFAIARLLRDGELDTSFGNDGKVTGSFGGCYYGLGGMALGQSGGIVVGGSCKPRIAVLARFDADGSPSQSFGHGGMVRRHVFINNVDGLALASHNRIVVAGPTRKAFGVLRFGRNGTYDLSFGDHGKAKAKFRNAEHRRVNAAAIDSRGRIVVAGTVQDEGFRSAFAFARFKQGGRVDRRFGNHGTVEVGRRKGLGSAASVAIDRRDRVVAAGPHVRHGRKRFAVVRLLG
jgi:uncharacterized delta-60 repeat protein